MSTIQSFLVFKVESKIVIEFVYKEGKRGNEAIGVEKKDRMKKRKRVARGRGVEASACTWHRMGDCRHLDKHSGGISVVCTHNATRHKNAARSAVRFAVAQTAQLQLALTVYNPDFTPFWHAKGLFSLGQCFALSCLHRYDRRLLCNEAHGTKRCAEKITPNSDPQHTSVIYRPNLLSSSSKRQIETFFSKNREFFLCLHFYLFVCLLFFKIS